MRKLAVILAALLILAGCANNEHPYSNIRNIHSPTGTNLVCFGDSLTAGEGAAAGRDYPSILRREFDMPVVNIGRSGDTTDKALDRIDEVLKNDPRIVIVEFGANDYLTAFSQGIGGAAKSHIRAFENLGKIVDKLQASGVVVIIAGIRLNDEYTKGYQRLAKRTRSALIPDIMEGVYGNQTLMSADNRHPNAKGYEKMAGMILKILRPLLAESRM